MVDSHDPRGSTFKTEYAEGYNSALQDITENMKTVYIVKNGQEVYAGFFGRLDAEECAKVIKGLVIEIPLNPPIHRTYKVVFRLKSGVFVPGFHIECSEWTGDIGVAKLNYPYVMFKGIQVFTLAKSEKDAVRKVKALLTVLIEDAEREEEQEEEEETSDIE